MGLDPEVTTVDFSAPVEVARGSAVSDSDGVRRATLLFEQGTALALVMANGSTQPLTGPLHVRATEYTVGGNGRSAMPAELPATSAYTYCVELSADEVQAAGAREVRFSKPVVFYLENFLHLPVGKGVPAGSYDRATATWKAEPDGRVIKIVGSSGGEAQVDLTGDDVAESSASLDSVGIDAAERQQLAGLYASGQSLWRCEASHFSPWDFNLAWKWVFDFFTQTLPDLIRGDRHQNDPCETGHSIIECQNQVLGERVPVTGTPFTLNYRSNRVPGFRAACRMIVPLTAGTVPAIN